MVAPASRGSPGPAQPQPPGVKLMLLTGLWDPRLQAQGLDQSVSGTEPDMPSLGSLGQGLIILLRLSCPPHSPTGPEPGAKQGSLRLTGELSGDQARKSHSNP